MSFIKMLVISTKGVGNKVISMTSVTIGEENGSDVGPFQDEGTAR